MPEDGPGAAQGEAGHYCGELLAEGAALSVLPQHLARWLAVAGQMRTLEVETPGLVMPVSVFTLAGAQASTAVDTFCSCLVEAAALR